jgi:hypothetical protein
MKGAGVQGCRGAGARTVHLRHLGPADLLPLVHLMHSLASSDMVDLPAFRYQ